LLGHNKRSEAIIQKIRDTGHRVTPQRLAIIRILVKSVGHPSVEDIYNQTKKDYE
jgi:Fur family peroxide stress response transcriptional regulator